MKPRHLSLVLSLSLTSLLVSACSASQSKSRLAANQGTIADQNFVDKFCDQVVDSLEPGSMHWMNCHSVAEGLLKQKKTQADVVSLTCEAIKNYLSEENLEACKLGGQRLITSESFGQAQKDMYERTARSLVACYEEVGVIQPTYDEEGRCSEDSELSAWNLTTERRTIPELKSFESLDSRQPTVGNYEGQIRFNNQVGRTCSFDLNFTYSGEDITVETDHFTCR